MDLGVGLVSLGISFLIFLIIGGVIFWLLMLIDCVKREFKNPTEKLIWVLVIIFLQMLGAIVYWAIGRKKE